MGRAVWNDSKFMTTAFGPLWGAVFTLLVLSACATDIRSRRIPNALVLALLICGVAFSVYTFPLKAALLSSAAGFVLGFLIWIAFWVLGMLGAGDVKFFAAMGAWLGPDATWRAALIAAILGGVLALMALQRDRRLKGGVEKTALALSSRSLGVMELTPEGEEARRRHLPYGVALAGGALALAWFPNLLK